MINVDEVVKNNGRIGCGGLLRDYLGCWLGGFSKNIGACNVLIAEMCGVLEGLKFALGKGYKKVELQKDNTIFSKAINKRNSRIREVCDMFNK